LQNSFSPRITSVWRGFICTGKSARVLLQKKGGYSPHNEEKILQKDFTISVQVEFEDVDSYGIAHHTKLIAYLERVRVQFLIEYGLDLRRERINLVLYKLDMNFLKPAFLLDKLEVSAFIKSINNFSLDLGYKLKRGSTLIAKASSTLAFVNPETKQIEPVPNNFFNTISGICQV